MQLSLKFVLGLIAASSVAFAAEPITVKLERRKSLFKDGGILDLLGLDDEVKRVNHKYKTAMDNFKRNTGEDHPLLSLLFDKRGSGETELMDVSNGLLWTGEVTFGGQKMHLDFDTGSADTIVNPEAYDPKKSHSAKKTLDFFHTAYGDGTASLGKIYTDCFSIGHLGGDNVALGRSWSKVTRSSEHPNKGISGLSFPSLSSFPKKYKSWFFALKDQNKLDSPVFQFTIKDGEGSSLHVGSVDSSKYHGDVAWANVDPSKGFWATDAKVNGQDITAIIDSGSTVITAPSSQVRHLTNKIDGLVPFRAQGQQMYAFHCHNPPDVTFTLGGRDFKLTEKGIKYGKTTNGMCVLSIVGVEKSPLNGWIVGDALFKELSIIFDAGKNRMGFAKQA